MAAAFGLGHQPCGKLLGAVACVGKQQLAHPAVLHAVRDPVGQHDKQVTVSKAERHRLTQLILLGQADGQRLARQDAPLPGLPAACLAMYHCVTNPDKKKYKGIFLGVALTSFITGITEPCEFMFLFVCPPLYVVHSLLDGLSFMVADLLNISIGNTFSGGCIDFLLFGVLQGNAKTNWLLELPVGAVWAVVYYFVFRFAITKFNIATPGRGDDMDDEGEVKLDTKSSMHEDALVILEALGGRENIEDVDACITRLRVAVKDSNKVDRELLKKVGATAVLEVQGGIQAIYGAKAILYKNEINDILGVAD